MTVHTLQPRTTVVSAAVIEFKAGYFVVDYDDNAISFTAEGEAYYSTWFRRFGFQLDARDARAFFETVMFINREVGGMQPEVLEKKLQGPDMGEQERMLWSKYLTGDYEAFARGLTEMAGTLENQSGIQALNVVPLR